MQFQWLGQLPLAWGLDTSTWTTYSAMGMRGTSLYATTLDWEFITAVTQRMLELCANVRARDPPPTLQSSPSPSPLALALVLPCKLVERQTPSLFSIAYHQLFLNDLCSSGTTNSLQKWTSETSRRSTSLRRKSGNLFQWELGYNLWWWLWRGRSKSDLQTTWLSNLW